MADYKLNLKQRQIMSSMNLNTSNIASEGNDESDNMSLAQAIAQGGEMYASPERDEFLGAQVGKVIRNTIPLLLTSKVGIDANTYKVEGSIGKGQFAEIPWISIFNRSITESATRGIYIVFLYSVDGKSVYLSLNQGYTYFSTNKY